MTISIRVVVAADVVPTAAIRDVSPAPAELGAEGCLLTRTAIPWRSRSR